MEPMHEFLLSDWSMARLYPRRATMFDSEGESLYFYPYELHLDEGYIKVTDKEGECLRIPGTILEWLRRGTDDGPLSEVKEEKKWEVEAGAMGLLFRLTSSPTFSSTKYLRQQFAAKGEEWALPEREAPSPLPANQEALPDYAYPSSPYPELMEEVECGWEVGAATVLRASEATRPNYDSLKWFQFVDHRPNVVWSDYNLYKHLFFPKGMFKPDNGKGRHFSLYEWKRGMRGAATVAREELFGGGDPPRLLPLPCIRAGPTITVITDAENVGFVSVENERVWWMDKKELVTDVNLGPAQDLFYSR